MRRNRFGAIKTVFDSKRFDSKSEATRYAQLKLLQQAGHIKGLKLQIKFPLIVAGQLICIYVADFGYVEDGRIVIEEYKGFMQAPSRIKHKLFQALYPKYKFRLTRKV